MLQLGYLQSALPAEAPETGESFDAVLQDVQQLIMPGWRVVYSLWLLSCM